MEDDPEIKRDYLQHVICSMHQTTASRPEHRRFAGVQVYKTNHRKARLRRSVRALDCLRRAGVCYRV